MFFNAANDSNNENTVLNDENLITYEILQIVATEMKSNSKSKNEK